MQEVTAFELLNQIRQSALGVLQDNISYGAQSTGTKNIAFSLDETNYYCATEHVKEVTPCENLMVIPQTKSWLRGLMNSKGILYSVTDLALFSGVGRPINPKRGHLILCSDDLNQCALLVDRVIGFRYFEQAKISDKQAKDDELLPDGITPFIINKQYSEGKNWYQIDVPKLLQSEQFREVQ